MPFWVKGLVACLLSTARAKDADAQNSFNDKYLKSYLPPGDEHYTDSWVGSNSSWRHYMSDFSGKSGDYQKYLSEYGGPQANYDQYVSLYASMAGSDVTSGDNYMGKGKSQLNAWNKSMMTTYNLYIPGPYENFAEQATEERTEKKGQGVGQGTMNEGHGGGGESEGGSGGTPWMPKGGKESHSQGGSGGGGGDGGGDGGGGGEVGYEPFARPWVVQYATSEGGHNAFDYEGKEFASGGMEMGGVQDYADYMNQYAGEWVPADSVEETHSEEKDGNEPSSKHHSGSSAKDKSKKEVTEDSKDDDSKQHHNAAHDSINRAREADRAAEAKEDVDPHDASDKSQDAKRSKALRHTDKKDQKEEKHHKSAGDKASKVVSLESASPEAPQPHPAQPVLPRWSVSKVDEMASMSHDVPHPAQPVLPQQSTAAKEALAEVRHAIKQLQQAAQDTTYAAWTMAKHSPAPELTEEQKQLAEAMSRLWKVTREPLNDKSMKELEDAGRSASMAIARLRDAELHQLRQSASSTRHKLLKGAKDWSEQLQRDAREQENDQLAQEAKEAGAELEKSLSDALSDRTQKKAQELLLHAKQRKQLLQGVLGEAVDVAQMVQKDATVTVAPPTLPKVEIEAVEIPRPSFAADKLKAVSGGYLLVAITIAGLFYSVAGFLMRRSAAPTRPASREIALLAMGEP